MDKYFDLNKELKKLWNMKVSAIPIVINALETVLRSKEKYRRKSEIESRQFKPQHC